VRLTGLPLITLVGISALVAVAATARGWRFFPVRVLGLLAVEILVVAGLALVVNRFGSFYPSWQSLGGVSDVAVASSVAPGSLDSALDGGGAVPWTPPEAGGWHLATAPRLVVPPDYAGHPDRTFPVLVVLTSASSVRAAPGVLVVVLAPTPATTAASLGTVSDSLRRDARAAGALVVLADQPWTGLAATWPGHPTVATGFDQAVNALPVPLAAPRKLPS
jgi:hypothetical protein